MRLPGHELLITQVPFKSVAVLFKYGVAAGQLKHSYAFYPIQVAQEASHAWQTYVVLVPLPLGIVYAK